MHATIKDIIDLFIKEEEVLKRLLSISEQKRAFIIGEDIAELKSLLESEAVLSESLRKLEEKRAILTACIADELGLSDRELTLEQLADAAGDAVAKEKLLDIRAELSGLLRKQKRYNRTNMELLSRKKNYINVILGALLHDEPLGGTYDSKGSTDIRYQSAGLFDHSV